MEQYSRANATEIQGIPVFFGILQRCKGGGKGSGPNCYGLHDRRLPSSWYTIVKFVRCIDKEKFMRKRCVMRNLSTRHMNTPMDQMVYVNEALIPARRRLLGAARQIERGGKIILRIDDGTNVVQVTCQAELNKLYFISLKKEAVTYPKHDTTTEVSGYLATSTQAYAAPGHLFL
ncbi:hypothetical protein J6590_078736 [Homalodisca vitripennis]|nr:hypothetical protein J6590_078736 [Homalodisca vitripennis]